MLFLRSKNYYAPMSQHPPIFILVTLLLFPFCSCATKRDSHTREANTKLRIPNSTKVTRSRTDYRPIATTQHQHNVQLKWLIDSGASETILFLDRVKNNPDVLLGPSQHYRIHGISGSKNKSLQSFSLPSNSMPTISGIAISSKNTAPHHHVNGILGINFLSKHQAILLISDKMLIWGNRAKSVDAQSIKLTIHPKTKHLILTAYYNAQPLYFIVDTGAKRSLLSLHSAKRLGLHYTSTPESVSGFNGNLLNTSRINKLSLDIPHSKSVKLNNVLVVEFRNMQSQLPSLRSHSIDGLIGYDFLKKNCTSIDFGAHSLSLKRH